MCIDILYASVVHYGVNSDDDITELRAIGGDFHPAEESFPSVSEFFRMFEKYKKFQHFDSVPRLNEIIHDAVQAGIPRIEVEEVFYEPLPTKIEDAKVELVRRLIGLEQRIKIQLNKPQARMAKALEYLAELEKLDAQINFEASTINEYSELVGVLGADDKFSKHISYLFNNWRESVTNKLKKLWSSEIGDLLQSQNQDFSNPDLDRELMAITSLYIQNKDQAHDLINRHLPWVRQQLQHLKHAKRAVELFKDIPMDAWKGGSQGVVFTPEEIEELNSFSESSRFFGEIWLNNKLSQLNWRKYCTISSMASLVLKPGKKVSTQAQVKAVKRKFRGLKPAGKEGTDYKVITATKTHVKDGTAFEEGQQIYSYIQGRTKFNTKSVIQYLHHKEQIQQVQAQLRKELGHKPTADIIAREMGLPVNLVWMFLG